VIAALRRIKVPNVRWPGGCFADYYRWRDGVGVPARRPKMVNTLWGNVVEDNSFGTHEFFEMCGRIGAEPFVVGQTCGSGSPREMAEWWEYLNHPGGSALADERKANGSAAPFNVRWFGVGNESWGCGGNMRPSTTPTCTAASPSSSARTATRRADQGRHGPERRRLPLDRGDHARRRALNGRRSTCTTTRSSTAGRHGARPPRTASASGSRR
jgi:alpha-L-arabinofuranosidase